jgi:hypothetical protein
VIKTEKRELAVKLVSGLTKDEWQRIRNRIDALFEKKALKVRIEGKTEEALIDHILKNEWDLAISIPEQSESNKD